MKGLYLAGPIFGCTDGEAKDWRKFVRDRLGSRFQIIDPMEHDYRGREDDYFREIVLRDYQRLHTSDFMLAMAEQPSWGTAMEIRTAHVGSKYVMAICSHDRISPWLRYHTNQIVKSVDEAISNLWHMA